MAESPTASGGAGARGFSPQAFAQAKARLTAQGVTYGQWADEHGFSRRLVYEVLAGRRACRRGVSHAVAVALGLKDATAGDQLEGVRG
ncbi:DNA-binding protein [Sphingobium sp. DC-2]|uniref:DNA-binding protein n=1 Tax=Sphingobium sp. DC-2 TaxID=1303256 RepID=UPI0005621527|nr:DNA-binding protein [Sphingobium sp. DC-2]